VSTIVRRIEAGLKRAVAKFEEAQRKAELREKDYSLRLTHQEATFAGLLQNKDHDELARAQGLNVLVAARNLRQAQRKARNSRLSCEYFQDMLDEIEEMVATEEFVNSAVPFAKILKKYDTTPPP